MNNRWPQPHANNNKGQGSVQNNNEYLLMLEKDNIALRDQVRQLIDRLLSNDKDLFDTISTHCDNEVAHHADQRCASTQPLLLNTLQSQFEALCNNNNYEEDHDSSSYICVRNANSRAGEDLLREQKKWQKASSCSVGTAVDSWDSYRGTVVEVEVPEEIESRRRSWSVIGQHQHLPVVNSGRKRATTSEFASNMFQQRLDLERQQHTDTVAVLESKVEELQRKYEIQAARHKELSQELSQLKRQASLTELPCSTDIWKKSGHHSLVEDGGGPGSFASASASAADLVLQKASASAKNLIVAVSPKHASAKPKSAPAEHRILPSLNFKTQDKDNCKQSPTRSVIEAWLTKNAGRLYRARYNYQPARDSPNDNPDAELSLQAGEFVLIHGVDEDGFFDGELLTGARGLVPSNFVERVPDHELFTCLPSTSKQLNSSVSSVADSLQYSSGLASFLKNLPSNSASQQANYKVATLSQATAASKVSTMTQVGSVPFPRDLLVERKLTKSVLISWSPPENTIMQISQYHVCVDGIVKAVVPGTYKTKTLIEDIDCNKVQRLSVRAVTEAGYSPDACCTIIIGRDALVSPQDVKCTNITPITAQVSWYPSNSNLEHVILLNGLKVGTCPPGVYQILLKGLIPSTMYRCSVRVKNPRAVLEEKPVESYADLKTLPKIGLPDPPSDVKCELGPQDGSLLITWTPVTTQPKPPSRAAVSGYLVYADGRKIKEIDSSTGDHIVIRLSDFIDDPPLYITVRTRTREGAISSDSNVVRVPRYAIPGSGFSPQRHGDVVLSSGIAQPSALVPSMSAAYASPVHHQGLQSTAGIFKQNPTDIAAAAQTSADYVTSNGQLGSGGLLMIQQTQLQDAIPECINLTYKGSSANFGAFSQVSSSVPADSSRVPTYASTSRQYALQQPGMNILRTVAMPYHQTGTASSLGDSFSSSRLLTTTAVSNNSAASDQYYVFHPQLMHSTPGSEKPSLLEMENNYLVKHHIPATSLSGHAVNPTVAALRASASSMRTSVASSGTMPHGASVAAAEINGRRRYSFAGYRNLPVINPSTGEPRTLDEYSDNNGAAATSAAYYNSGSNRLDQYFNQPYGKLDEKQLNKRRAAMRIRSYSADEDMKRSAEVLPQYAPESIRAAGHIHRLVSGVEDRLTGAATETGTLDLSDEEVDFSDYADHSRRPANFSRRKRKSNRAYSEPDLRSDEAVMARDAQGLRFFVALYDYSPRHMSPNPNAMHEELSFRKGQIIKVFGDKDTDGFYHGELQGRTGLVPSNLVSELVSDQINATVPLHHHPHAPPEQRFHSSQRDYASASLDSPSGVLRQRYEKSLRYQSQNSSDPSLAQRLKQTNGRAPYVEYSDSDSVAKRQDPHHRRARLKQKSYSLDYDKVNEEARAAAVVDPYGNSLNRGTCSSRYPMLPEDVYEQQRSSARRDSRSTVPRQSQHTHHLRDSSLPVVKRSMDRGEYVDHERSSYYVDSRYVNRHQQRDYDQYLEQQYSDSPKYPPSVKDAAGLHKRSTGRYGPEDRARSLDYCGIPPAPCIDSYASIDRRFRSSLPADDAGADEAYESSPAAVAARFGYSEQYPEDYGGSYSKQHQNYDRYYRGRSKDAAYGPASYSDVAYYSPRGGTYGGSRRLPDESMEPLSEEERYRRQQRRRPLSDYERNGRAYYDEVEGGKQRVDPRLKSQFGQHSLPRDAYDSHSLAQEYVRRNSEYQDTQMAHRIRGSFRKEGRDKLEQSIRSLIRDAPARRTVALYDYDPRESSPNVDAEMELNFRAGDVIIIYGDVDDDGFYVGECGSQRGLVPSNFLAPELAEPRAQLPESYESPRSKKDGVTFYDNTLPGGDSVESPTQQMQKRRGEVLAANQSPSSSSSAKQKSDAAQKQSSQATVNKVVQRQMSSSATGKAPVAGGGSKTGGGKTASSSGGAAKGSAAMVAASKQSQQKKSMDAGGARSSPGQQRKASMPAKTVSSTKAANKLGK